VLRTSGETPSARLRHRSMRIDMVKHRYSPTLVRPGFCRVLSCGILCDFAERLNKAKLMIKRQKQYN